MHVGVGNESPRRTADFNYDRTGAFVHLVDSRSRTAALRRRGKDDDRSDECGKAGSPAQGETTIHSLVLLRPLRQHLILLLPRQLQVLLAEEPEPRSLRPVRAAWIAAAHVSFQSTSATATRSSAVAWRASRYQGGDTISEDLGEFLNEHVDWMRGVFGHKRCIAHRLPSRNQGSGPMPLASASSISLRMRSMVLRSSAVGACR